MDIWFFGGLAISLILIALLATTLIADSHGSVRAKSLSRILTIPTWIFFAAFVVVILVRVVALLG